MVLAQQPRVWKDPIHACVAAAIYLYVVERWVYPILPPTDYLSTLILHYMVYITLYFGCFGQGLLFDHSTLTTAPSSLSVLDALKHSFTLCQINRPSKKGYHRHEKYLILRIQKGIAWYKRPLEILSVLGICWALCTFYWRFLNPRTNVNQLYESDNDFMSLYRADFSLSQGFIFIHMAISAVGSIIFARIYGRRMGNDSLVRLVHESLREAKEQYGYQGEELWLQWWIDEVSKESDRLQDELQRKKFEKAGMF